MVRFANKTYGGHHQLGITLVEVLVTLVSTSVGLLGIAALQLVSLRSDHAAHVRVQASTLASSMLERIRINPRGLSSGEYDAIDFNALGVAGTRSSADLHAWQSEIDRALPGGTDAAAGSVRRMPNTSLVTVVIRWDDRQGGDRTRSSAATTIQMQAEL